jgi:organic hydroperoxide reductase OsmC/OhrA
MSEHRAHIAWRRTAHEFTPETYPRDHEWRFPGGSLVAASSAPEFKGNPERVNPEESFTAALASCHMLTFLALAAKRKLTVDHYEDDPVGTLARNAEGRTAMTQVVLRPRIRFGGEAPSPEALALLHEQAHKHCFIANSVLTEVVVEPPVPD